MLAGTQEPFGYIFSIYKCKIRGSGRKNNSPSFIQCVGGGGRNRTHQAPQRPALGAWGNGSYLLSLCRLLYKMSTFWALLQKSHDSMVFVIVEVICVLYYPVWSVRLIGMVAWYGMCKIGVSRVDDCTVTSLGEGTWGCVFQLLLSCDSRATAGPT